MSKKSRGKWISAKSPGVRYYEHESRIHKRKPDRYFSYRYQAGSFKIDENVGWASDGWDEDKVASLRGKYKMAAKALDGSPRSLKEEKEAHQLQVEKERLEGEAAAMATKTIREWGQEFIDSLPDDQNKQDDKNRLVRHIYPAIGDKIPGELKEKDMVALMRGLKKKAPMRRPNKTLAPRTVEQIMTTLGKVYGFADLKIPPWRKKAPKYDNTVIRWLTRLEARMLMDCLCERTPRGHDQAMIALHCGLRAGEILKLRVMHCNLHEGLVEVVDTKNKSRNRSIIISPHVKKILTRRTEGKKPGDLVFPNRQGKVAREITKAYYREVDELGFNDGIDDQRFTVDFHTLRHTYASWLMQSGKITLYELKDRMGHSSIDQTEKYAKLAPENKEKDAGVFDDF